MPELAAELYAKISQLTVEWDFLSRGVRAMTRAERVAMIARCRADLSVRRVRPQGLRVSRRTYRKSGRRGRGRYAMPAF